jgi:GTPase SAR1 family protein
MKLMMLGHSGVGKTTYMATMYGEMQSRSVWQRLSGGGNRSAFTINAVNDDDHRRFLAIHKDVCRGKYPSPTNQREQYDFRLKHKNSDFNLPFTWVDYRGGAMMEKSTTGDGESLLRGIRECDGLILFFDGTCIHENSNHTSAEIRRIIQFVQQALTQEEKLLPLVIILTKSDVRSENAIHPLLAKFIETISGNECVNGTVIETACARTRFNTELPVMFCLCFSVFLDICQLRQQLAELETIAAHWDQKKGFWNSLATTFTGEESAREKAEMTRDRARRQLAKLDKVRVAVEPLVQHLVSAKIPVFGKCPIFSSNE